MTNEFSLLILLFLNIIDTVIPKLTRKDLYFGIRIPSEKRDIKSMKKIYIDYIKKLWTVSLIYILLSYFNPLISENSLVFIIELIGLIGLNVFFYLNARKEVKSIKREKNWGSEKSEVLYVTNEDINSEVISYKWYFLTLIIIALTGYFIIINYENLPKRLPIHFNAKGIGDQFVDKSYISALFLPVIEIFLLAIFIFVNYSIKNTKKQIDVEDPKESIIRNIKFRGIWSKVLYIVYLIILATLTLNAFKMINLLNINPKVFQLINYISIGTILLLILVTAFKTGQGGTRLSKHKESKDEINIEDDKYWKLGLFYFNKDDPSIFIEKRLGIGFTMNFANPISILIIVVLLLIIFGISILPKIL
ncbi:MAG: DUF1648 domain-containing protein [Bacillota bacterium]